MVADWYPTLSSIFCVDPADDALLNGMLHPIDGVDIWGAITSGDAPEREKLPITEDSLIWHSKAHNTTFKLITKAHQTKWYLENETQVRL